MNWCQGDGFSSVGARTSTIKLAMAGTQDWWRRFHCWVANSIWLERASNSFHGGLFRALTNFIAVLPVNNTLIRRVWPASSWPRDSLS